MVSPTFFSIAIRHTVSQEDPLVDSLYINFNSPKKPKF